LLSAIIVTSVHSHLLHPYDQAVGLWNLTLCRRDRALLESMVFPPLPLNGENTLDSDALDVDQTDAAAADDAAEEKGAVSSIIEIRRPRRQKRLECELRLNSDGTFVLSPPSSLDRRGIDSNVGKRVPLEGCWKLRQNPYCVTDRHYDQLSLVSYPKVRLHSSVVDSEAKETSQHDISERDTVTLEMRCKVWGRYGSNTIRRLLNYPLGKDASRLTQGTLSAKFSQPDAHKNRVRRVVCATFQAKSCSIIDNERDTEDEDDEFWEYE